MSQPWIKIETITPEKPEIDDIATGLGMDRDAVMGKLVRIWAYFDQHSTDGHIDGKNGNFIDRLVGRPGFSEQLVNVGWLVIEADCIRLPNFDRHNGQTAKARALTGRRVEKHRAERCKGKALQKRYEGVTDALPDKRRQDKRREDHNPPLPPQGGYGGEIHSNDKEIWSWR
jgi:hypothetical protein